MKQKLIFLICLIGFVCSEAQVSQPISWSWLVTLQRKDGILVPFQMKKFLTEYYNQNRLRGIEIIALAYELTTDFNQLLRAGQW